MNRLIQILLATLLLALLPTAEASAQIRRAQPHRKPPTSTTTPTKPKPTKPRKPVTATNSSSGGFDVVGNVEEPVNTEPRVNMTITVNGVSFLMIGVQGGTFMMGATSEQESDADSDEKPAHQVTLSSFSIGETEVTQELWQAVMGSNPSDNKGPKRPVENVSWKDCQDFIQKLNKLTGRRFRLPTEAEWEYAARGANHSCGYIYAGGNSIDDVAWYYDGSLQTHDVGTKRANELGLYDMSGNVMEWCQDWYGSYRSGSQTNPRGASSGSDRVNRGGCWYNTSPFNCRVSCRNYNKPSQHSGTLGLRLAL